jgi:class 3 adenylate cyclase/tetratricopeptide (TPR) repeat protein
LLTGELGVSESIELATILLTDLVGSTRLAMSVGPARADVLREEHFGLLREAIGSSGGREVKNTGDGLMVAFSSASAAVDCAVLMQQRFERRYRRAEQSLHIRVGLGAGESTVKDGDYFGTPSVEAARLCDRAPSDGIYVSATVKLLAGRAGEHGFESVGALELKGFPDPVEVFAVSWAPLGEEGDVPGGWPLPAVLRSVPRLAYVGRDGERALLGAAVTAARAGARQAVLLSGEPGIGKSRLAAFVASGAHGGGFAVCWGGCNEDVGAPYEPWIEVCTQLVEHAPDQVLAAHLEGYGGEVSRLARNLGRRVPGVPAPQSSDPETERFLLFKAVTGLLADVSASLPVCVVLDDFHWADGQSVALLKHVVRSLERAPLTMIVTYRDTDLGKDHPLTGLLADLHGLEGVERIALQGLGAGEVGQVLSAAAGHELDDDGVALAGEIAQETNGNPFFVEEVLRSLLESGRLEYDEASGRWAVDRSTAIGLPESVRDVVERRVARLGADAREALTVAAVIGRSFDLEVLSRVVDAPESRLLDQLEAAVAASLLDESTEQVGRFRFVHALINQTLYEGLGATRRARLHHRVAQALEELCGSDPGERLGELALHWRLATTAVDQQKAAEYAARAGQRALDQLAPAQAARLFGDAVELYEPGDTAARCRALIGLGEAHRLVGAAAHRETLLEASRIAAALENPELAARAVLENSRGLPSAVGEIDTELLAAIERALELDDGSDPARRARLLAIQALELSYDQASLERRRAISEDAVTLARDSGDPTALAAVLREAWTTIFSADTLARLDEISEELLVAAASAQDPALGWWARQHECLTSVMLGRFERAAAALEQLESITDDLGQPALRWHAAVMRCSWEQLHGNLDAADQHRERALALGQDAVPVNAALYYGANLSMVRVHQGRGEEVITMLEGGVATYPGIPAWRAGLAAAYCRIGALDKASAIIEDAASDRFAHVPWDPPRMTALVLYADAAAQAGSLAAAEPLYELLEPWADQVVYSDPVGYGHARLWLGALAHTLGRDGAAVEHLEFACRFHEENRLLEWAAESHIWLARALARAGNTEAAREHARRALELARANGYRPLEPRAAELLTDAETDHRASTSIAGS